MLANPWSWTAFLAVGILTSCTSGPKQSLQDIPEICRFVDFSKDPEMTKICGLRETRYGGLKNIPPMRFLISPKGGHLAVVQGKVELRLPNTGEIELGDSLQIPLDFSPYAKREFVKNSYEYFEIYPNGSERLRLFRLQIPTLNAEQHFCFEIPSRITDERLKTLGGQQINKIVCDSMTRIVHADSLQHQKQMAQESVVDSVAILSPNQKLRMKRGLKPGVKKAP